MAPTSHYEENMPRYLQVDPTMLNQLLFDVHFENSAYFLSAPGMKILPPYLFSL
jgi:hypothetical protein